MQINISIKAKEYRLKKGLTTRQVADTINLTETEYKQLEKGKYNPHYYTVIELAKLYNVPISYIFDQSKVLVKTMLENFINKDHQTIETDEYIEYKYS